MADTVLCACCGLQHIQNAPCPPAALVPPLLSRTSIPEAIHPQAPPANHPNLLDPDATAISAATTTGSATDQPTSQQQVEPLASPSQSRSWKRQEAPGASSTQREQRREWYKADMKQRYAKKPRRQEKQEGKEEEQRVVHAMAAWKARAEGLEAEKEALTARLEEERERNEEAELWRRNTMEPF